MSRAVCLIGVVGALYGCAGGAATVRRPPAAALAAARARLIEQGIALDPTLQGGARLRSVWFCFVPAGREGLQWSSTFARVGAGPTPFTVEGPVQVQDEALARCAHQVRFELDAQTSGEGSRLRFTSEWMRAAIDVCTPIEPALLGARACRYAWRPSGPQENLEGALDDVLNGL
jgi:hypothetical protein